MLAILVTTGNVTGSGFLNNLLIERTMNMNITPINALAG